MLTKDLFSFRSLQLPLILLLKLAVVVAYWPTLLSMHGRWSQSSDPYSHGYLLFAYSLWLIYSDRQRLLETPRTAGWLALPLLLGASLLWLAGDLVQVLVAQQVVLPALPLLMFWALAGFRAALKVAVPIGVIYAVIPLWDGLVPTLQYMTVAVCEWVLRLVGIPAFIHEVYIQLPAGVLHVAAGCAGLNYLLVGTALAVLYCHMHGIRRWHKVLGLVGLGIFLGLAANWARVTGLSVIAHVTEMQSSLIKDHEMFGWVVFAVCLVPFFVLGNRVAGDLVAAAPVDEPRVSTGGSESGRYSFGVLFALTAAAALAGPVLAKVVAMRGATPLNFALPESLATAPRVNLPVDWLPKYNHADHELKSVYVVAGKPVQAVAYVYETQAQGKELVFFGHSLVDDQTWTLSGTQRFDGLRFDEIARQGGRKHMWVMSWYNVAGVATEDKRMAKLLQLYGALVGRSDASLLALAIPCDIGRCEAPDAEQLAWVREAKAALDERLVGAVGR